MNPFKAILSSKAERALAPYRARVKKINALGEALQKLDDAQLQGKFAELKQRRHNGEDAAALQNEVFAIVREASTRTLQMRHFDEQLLGGMALFDGKIAEMKTGEGKTLVATLPVCLEAISGKGVHVVTVNDYLAQRDAEWMGVLYRFLGLSVGVIRSQQDRQAKADAYASDIVYGTNNEFGFDYLRHNMRYSPTPEQGALNYAIVDEVDSILIDEARTPLIISGEANDNVDLYRVIAGLTGKFQRCATPEGDDGGDFIVDEKARSVHLTEQGFERAEQIFAEAGLMPAGESLYAPDNLPLMHHLDVGLRARHLFQRDQHYVVQNSEVIIVDEFTGRLMPGRRWGDNQHQAVEAKENVAVQNENRTLASISYQNYFRLYGKLAGMTGTAMTEAQEFEFIYGLHTLEIPTHQKMVREDELDKVYQTAAARDRAVLEDIKDAHTRGQPVLVGTTVIEASEQLSKKLADAGLAHNVLNAKQHAQEAQIIEQAGVAGAITIATNMAGRGTDIVLGGNLKAREQELASREDLSGEEKAAQLTAVQQEWNAAHENVLAAGGLRIIGTERHESRRVDNQLRGRAGRQGDSGSSIFYLSFDDSLLRIFATKYVASLMEKLKLEEDEAIEAKMVSRTIENAQRKVEAHNFDIRRQLLEYDDIANEQRRLIYEQREAILTSDDIADISLDFRMQHLDALCDEYMPPDATEEEWRTEALEKRLTEEYRLPNAFATWVQEEENKPRAHFVEKLKQVAEAHFAAKFEDANAEQVTQFMRMLILNVIDENWRTHLSALDGLRMSIGFRGVAQKNPKQEYKREAFAMFNHLLTTIQATVSRLLYAMSVKPAEAEAEAEAPSITPPPAARPAPTPVSGEQPFSIQKGEKKVGRNSPCPCGSGKKYKHCHGKL